MRAIAMSNSGPISRSGPMVSFICLAQRAISLGSSSFKPSIIWSEGSSKSPPPPDGVTRIRLAFDIILVSLVDWHLGHLFSPAEVRASAALKLGKKRLTLRLHSSHLYS